MSVIIATYNRAPFIREAIDSVLRQTYQHFEIIVVDDGSTDDTSEVMAAHADPRITYVQQRNGGLSSARTTGLDIANGEFIALLDSDDAWEPWKLAAQVEIARRHPEVGLVWTDMTAVSPTGAALAERHLRTYYAAYRQVAVEQLLHARGTLSDLSDDAPSTLGACPYLVGEIGDAMFIGNFVHPPTAFVRRTRLQLSGPYQPEVTGSAGEDYHFFYRVTQHGPVAFLDAPAIRYRIHPEQVSTLRSLEYARSDLRLVQHWIGQATTAIPRDVVRRRLASAHGWLAYEELSAGNPEVARGHFARSLLLRPNQPNKLLLAAASLLPREAVSTVRAMKRTMKTGATRQTLLRVALPLSGAAYVVYRLLGALQPEFADALP